MSTHLTRPMSGCRLRDCGALDCPTCSGAEAARLYREQQSCDHEEHDDSLHGAGSALNRYVEVSLLAWISEGAPFLSRRHFQYIAACQRRNSFEDMERARSDGEKWGKYDAQNVPISATACGADITDTLAGQAGDAVDAAQDR